MTFPTPGNSFSRLKIHFEPLHHRAILQPLFERYRHEAVFDRQLAFLWGLSEPVGDDGGVASRAFMPDGGIALPALAK